MKESNKKSKKEVLIKIGYIVVFTILIVGALWKSIFRSMLAQHLSLETIAAMEPKVYIAFMAAAIITIAHTILETIYYLFISTKGKNKYFILRNVFLIAWLYPAFVMADFLYKLKWRVGYVTIELIDLFFWIMFIVILNILTRAEQKHPEAIVGFRRKQQMKNDTAE